MDCADALVTDLWWLCHRDGTLAVPEMRYVLLNRKISSPKLTALRPHILSLWRGLKQNVGEWIVLNEKLNPNNERTAILDYFRGLLDILSSEFTEPAADRIHRPVS